MSEKLSYEGFRNVILAQVKKRFSEEAGVGDIHIHENVKNNDTVRESIMIQSGENRCIPCLYIDDMYYAYTEKDVNIEDITEGVWEIFHAFSDQVMPSGRLLGELISDFNRISPYIECRLVNGDTNRQRLRGRPSRSSGEFALAYQVRVGEADGGVYMMQIEDAMLREWEIDADELYEIAMQNMDLPQNFVIHRLDEMLNLPQKIDMYILTNREKVNGATVIISDEVRRRVAEHVGGDYYILPSSIHELIIVPKKGAGSPESLVKIVRDANRSQYVTAEEFLSDNVYEYSLADECVSRASGSRVVA